MGAKHGCAGSQTPARVAYGQDGRATTERMHQGALCYELRASVDFRDYPDVQRGTHDRKLAGNLKELGAEEVIVADGGWTR